MGYEYCNPGTCKRALIRVGLNRFGTWKPIDIRPVVNTNSTVSSSSIVQDNATCMEPGGCIITLLGGVPISNRGQGVNTGGYSTCC